jgi:type IV pilus assembly protein PilA
MKSELKAKFIAHLAQSKKNNEGFTLIELLVVIIIIGILSAIALPSFLNQANKAKQSEAKQYVGALVRAQQAFYLENSTFTSDFEELGKVVKAKTTNYSYPMALVTDLKKDIKIDGESLKLALKPYQGQVEISNITTTSEVSTVAILCENKAPLVGKAKGGIKFEKTGEGTCGSDMVELGLK